MRPAEFDPAELLAPYTGDIVAEGVGKVLRGGAQFLLKGQSASSAMSRKRSLKSGAAPGPLELAGLLKRQRLLSARWPHWKNGWKRWRANDAGELRRLYFIIHTF